MIASALTDNGLCFGCGPRNAIGLRLTFGWDGDTYFTRWTPRPEHQGWADRVHGGLLALVLDESLSRAALERHGLDWVTAELTTRLKRPAVVGDPLRIEAWIVTVRPRLIVCEGEVRTENGGLLIAAGQAKLMRAVTRD
ncbi:MAG: PaaI family thioesterase [Armatimonadota bacterium]|nr:PaaI family thioesterase [Armatimonadota bacterium]